MLLALVVAVLAVALGAALTAASGTRPSVIGLLRTFAATAAAAVVFTHLLPDALSGAGLWGALAFLAGLLTPQILHPLTERLASRRTELSEARVALEAGFIGLVVHHVGDGLGIGAYAALPGGVLGNLDVVLALIAHTVPLVAVVTLAYRSEYGLRAALVRAAALALASVVGVLASFAVPANELASASAWIGALVSGVLLHVVTHDWLEDLPQTEPAKLLDLAAAGLGLSLLLLGGHEPHHAETSNDFFESALLVAQRSAPFLLLGLGLTAALGNRVEHGLSRLGESLPSEFAKRIGFALGAEGLLLGLASYGALWMLAALLATTVVPLVAALAAMLAVAIAGEKTARQVAERMARSPRPRRDRLRRFDRATAIWVLALALAAVFDSALASGALLGSIGSAGELGLSAALGLLLGTGGPIVVALGALTQKGLSPGAALLGAVLSSALGAGKLLALWRTFGARALLPALLWLVCLCGIVAIGVNGVAPIPAPLRFPAGVEKACLALLLLLVLARAERVGVRSWLAGWLAEAGTPGHHHHAHPHPHSSESPNGSAATTRSPAASGPSAEA